MKDIVIFGAGGHARELAQIIRDINRQAPRSWNLLGFLVDAGATCVHDKPLPGPLLGGLPWLDANPTVHVIVAIGDPVGRQAVVRRLLQQNANVPFATLVHPRAWLADNALLGHGSVVFASACIQIDTAIGAHASINLGCTISHDCVLGDYVNLGPGVHLGGGCEIGQGADLGVGVSMRPQARAGAGCVIGAGAVVVADVPAACVAVGVPARSMRD